MIDSYSTLNLISNKSWLSDIHEVDTTMHIHSTGGVSITHKMGYLGNYPTTVWYLPDGNANILSLRNVTRHYQVTMDTAVENAIILHGADKQQHRFIPSGKGLYKWEHTMDPAANNPCWLFIMTVCSQADCYTYRAYELWAKPGQPQGENHMSSKQTHPSRDLRSPSFHSQAS